MSENYNDIDPKQVVLTANLVEIVLNFLLLLETRNRPRGGQNARIGATFGERGWPLGAFARVNRVCRHCSEKFGARLYLQRYKRTFLVEL